MLIRRTVKAGATSVVVNVPVLDSASTTGGRKTGILYSGITAYYKRSNGTAAVASTLAAITTFGTFAGSATNTAFKELDAANTPGLYEVHLPNNMLAAGATEATLVLKGAAGMEQVEIQVELLATVPADIVALIGTPAGASVSADIAARSSQATQDALRAVVDNIHDTDLPAVKTSADLANRAAPPTATDIATAVWAATGRTLSAAALTAQAVWEYATRTLSAFSFTPNAGNMVSAAPSVTSIVNGVWNENVFLHGTPNTAGISLYNATLIKLLLDDLVDWVADPGFYRFKTRVLVNAPSGSVNVAAIADAVWDEALIDHTAAGSAGKSILDVVTPGFIFLP